MRFKNKCFFFIFVVTVLAAFTFAGSRSFWPGKEAEAQPKPDLKRKSRFYRGISEKALYSRSSIPLSNSEYTFSDALQGDTIEHDFFLYNEMKDPILLEKVKSCSVKLFTIFCLILTGRLYSSSMVFIVLCKFLTNDDILCLLYSCLTVLDRGV